MSIFNFLSDIILQYNHYCCVALAHMLPHEACQVRGCLASRWFQLLFDMLAFFFLLVHLAYLHLAYRHMALSAILHMALHETCQVRACFSSRWLLPSGLVLNFDPLCILHCNTLLLGETCQVIVRFPNCHLSRLGNLTSQVTECLASRFCYFHILY